MVRSVPFVRLLRRPTFRIAAVCALVALPLAALADELTLKDGTKVKGNIVGFDDNSFKVETSFGYALVRKDQVVAIFVTGAGNPPTTTPTPSSATPSGSPSPSADKAPAPKAAPVAVAAATPAPEAARVVAPAAAPAPLPVVTWGPPPPLPSSTVIASSLPSTKASATAKTAAPAPAASNTVASAKASASVPAAPAAAPAHIAPTAAVIPPPKPPAPEPIHETVNGNTYANNTYRFQMFKPPSWQVLAAERTLLPGSITAMGTDDQETYLLIGQEPAGKALYLAAAAADKRLSEAMENFRPQGQEQMLVAGSWATAHRFRGSVDQHEWSGVVVLVPHGQRLFTIFGMTRADSDLVQIQENVIDRAIASLAFTD